MIKVFLFSINVVNLPPNYKTFMKKIILTLGLSLVFSGFSTIYAQRKCATMDHFEAASQRDPQFSIMQEQINLFTQQAIENGTVNQDKSVINIPVVVHVLYNTSTQNISLTQIQSQIDVLNKDFRKLNSDWSNTPSIYQSLVADIELTFCLATVDPNGNATSGIIRKSTTKTVFDAGLDDAKYNSTGGSDAWPAGSYLNIWVVPSIKSGTNTGILGYAQFPGGAVATDGLVICHNYFGTSGTVTAPFNKGRTATHEIGHWLNLRHIWGDANCGNDQVADTPTQSAPNYNCPTFPKYSCSNSGDMHMNYMDYVDDACMYMFSTGQKSRMRALFASGGARASLLNSNGCGGSSTPPTASYCTSNGTNVQYEWINNVTLGTINNTTNANGGYGDFTNLSTSLTPGTTYSISLKPAFSGSTYTEYFKVYIDYNNDKDFDDAGENVYSSAGTTTTVTGSFTVPSTATAGATRMRVIMKDGTISGPCGSFTYGEVEDYTINIVSGSTCNAPTGLASSSITTTSATLSWTAVSGASSYTVQVKPSTSSTWTSYNTTSNSLNLSGLASSTTYNWQVATTCSSTTSSYTVGTNFTTATVCNAPSGLASSSITSNSATLSWTAVSGASNYTVQVKPSSSSTWTSLSASTNSIGVTSLTSGTTYNWQVRTNCTSGSSSYTVGSNFTTSSSTTCSDAYESNNTLSAAKSISVNTNITASIGTSTDVDWFKFSNTSTAKNIRVTLSNLPADYDLYLYNSSGTLLFKSENGSNTSELIKYNNAPVATYFILVKGYNGAFSSSSCYTLNASRSSSAYKLSEETQEEEEIIVSKIDETIFTIMPNPSIDGKFTFNLTNSEVGLVNVDVYDQSGRVVFKETLAKAEEFLKSGIDLSEKTKGMYIVKIYNDAFHITERILFSK
jgi:hypothetical protein